MRRGALVLLVLCLASCPAAVGAAHAAEPDPATPPSAALADGERFAVTVERAADGSPRFVLESGESLTATELGERFGPAAPPVERPWWQRLANVDSVAGLFWVGLGFLAQAVFASRMIVQWITSERRGRSVVPVAFWWLSLAGASMLLVYFAWRRDPVGILGQTTGWLIYTRNLWLVYRGGG